MFSPTKLQSSITHYPRCCQLSNDNSRNEDSTILFIYNVLSVKITVLNVASLPLLSIVTLQQRQ